MITPRARFARRDDRWPVVTLALVFLVSRIFYWALGVRFSTDQLSIAIQYLDPELLRSHLLESIWHLHIQPPLFNLGLGLVLKALPSHPAPAFHAVYLALGLTEILCLFALVKGLGGSVRLAWVIAALVSVSPASILYENRLFYDYVALVLLTIAALLAVRLERSPSFGRGVALFAVLGVLVLTRAVYQPMFLLIAVAVVAGLRVLPVRQTLAAAAPALVVVGALMIHDVVSFGMYSTSSFMGDNLARVAVNPAPLELRRRLVAAGELDSIVLVPNFDHVDTYLPYVGSVAPTGVAALDEKKKSTGGTNHNNAVFLRVEHRLFRASLSFAVHHPRWYARGVQLATERYLWPPTYPEAIVGDNKNRVARLEAVFEAGFYGSTPHANRVGFVTVLLLLVAVGFGLRVLAVRAEPHRFAIVFVLFLITYTTAIGVLADLGENYRTRLLVDPLVLALAGVAVARLWHRRFQAEAEPQSSVAGPDHGGASVPGDANPS
jgi:hypothetical protein